MQAVGAPLRRFTAMCPNEIIERSSVAERWRHTTMLMGHPPPIIARGRENRPQGGREGLTPVQVPMVVQELVACDAEVQEALADTLEAVQKIAQAGPQAFHRV